MVFLTTIITAWLPGSHVETFLSAALQSGFQKSLPHVRSTPHPRVTPRTIEAWRISWRISWKSSDTPQDSRFSSCPVSGILGASWSCTFFSPLPGRIHSAAWLAPCQSFRGIGRETDGLVSCFYDSLSYKREERFFHHESWFALGSSDVLAVHSDSASFLPVAPLTAPRCGGAGSIPLPRFCAGRSRSYAA